MAHMIGLGLAAVACGWDLRTRRIPQLLTLGGALRVWCSISSTADGAPAQPAPSAGPSASRSSSCRLRWAVWRRRRQVAGRDRRVARPDERDLGRALRGCGGRGAGDLRRADQGYLIKRSANVGVMLTYWRVNGVRPLPELTLEHSRGPAARVCPADSRRNDGDAMAAMNTRQLARIVDRPHRGQDSGPASAAPSCRVRLGLPDAARS